MEKKKQKFDWKMAGLAVLFAGLMSLPFLVPHLGFLALFGFVPLLFMDTLADLHRTRHFWWWHYAAFVLWNAATTFWVCNATVGGGIFAVLANAFQMSLVVACYRFGKRFLPNTLSYALLVTLWIAWERFYFSAQISWPWLTLGNAFARTTALVQWYEYTGALGGSLWIWLCNLGAFLLLLYLLGGSFRSLSVPRRIALPLGYAAVLLAPMALSIAMYRGFEEQTEDRIDVVVAQPNFDPYQKFESMTQEQQNAVLLGQLRDALASRQPSAPHLLLVGPETFTSDITLGAVSQSPTWQSFQAFLQDYPEANLLFGATTRRFIRSQQSPAPTTRHLRDDLWYQAYNSAFLTDARGREDVYHKSKLVVGVEMTPFPKFFGKIDDMLGGVMGRCIGQDEISTLRVDGIPLGCAICYESVYGEFCTGYVRKGAKVLAVITNDAWWGDTPGYRQHLSYACLRAIETRRDIVRCANTGISALINQRGDVLSETDWWTREVLTGTVSTSSRETFFVRCGDIVGRVCTYLFLLIALALLLRLFIRR